MRHQKIAGAEKEMFYLSPVHPSIYKLELNHSSQKFLFCYSVIETGPVNYDSGLPARPAEYTDVYNDSRSSDLPAEVDLTMENPDTYLKCAEQLSKSSEIKHQVKEK